MSDKFKTTEQRVSYGIGQQMGGQLSTAPFDGFEIEAVLEGITDALNGQPSQVEQSLLESAFQEIFWKQ